MEKIIKKKMKHGGTYHPTEPTTGNEILPLHHHGIEQRRIEGVDLTESVDRDHVIIDDCDEGLTSSKLKTSRKKKAYHSSGG